MTKIGENAKILKNKCLLICKKLLRLSKIFTAFPNLTSDPTSAFLKLFHWGTALPSLAEMLPIFSPVTFI